MLHVLVGSISTTGGKPGKRNILQLYYQYFITADTSGGTRIYRTGTRTATRREGWRTSFLSKFTENLLKDFKKWPKTVCVGERGHCSTSTVPLQLRN